jgi:hypothetical protein
MISIISIIPITECGAGFFLLLQMPTHKGLLALGVAAVGGTATGGVSELDAQRIKMVVSGQGPAAHPRTPLQAPPMHAPWLQVPATGNHMSDALQKSPITAGA